MALPRDQDARMYYRVAMQRYDEALLIFEKLNLYAAAQYLSGYAVECMFKALLITLTPPSRRPSGGAATVRWLKEEFGHDLASLRDATTQRGAPMPRSITGDFVFVSTWNPNDRYKPGPGDPTETKRFLASVETIVKWADGRM